MVLRGRSPDVQTAAHLASFCCSALAPWDSRHCNVSGVNMQFMCLLIRRRDRMLRTAPRRRCPSSWRPFVSLSIFAGPLKLASHTAKVSQSSMKLHTVSFQGQSNALVFRSAAMSPPMQSARYRTTSAPGVTQEARRLSSVSRNKVSMRKGDEYVAQAWPPPSTSTHRLHFGQALPEFCRHQSLNGLAPVTWTLA
jgi:hypothetical protein